MIIDITEAQKLTRKQMVALLIYNVSLHVPGKRRELEQWYDCLNDDQLRERCVGCVTPIADRDKADDDKYIPPPPRHKEVARPYGVAMSQQLKFTAAESAHNIVYPMDCCISCIVLDKDCIGVRCTDEAAVRRRLKREGYSGRIIFV